MLNPIKLPTVSPKQKNIALDTIFFTLGCLIFSASVAVFTAPNKMAPGGASGVATLIYYMIHAPIGITIIILNIPLFLLAFKYVGGKFILKSLICTFVSSIGVDLLSFLPKYDGFHHGSMLLAALYGGVLSGIGLGLIFMRGATTGGTDILSVLLKLKWPHVPLGRMMMFVDIVIIGASIFVFKSVDSGLYSIIQLFVSSKVIDMMLYGSDNGKMFLVISNKNEEIAATITNELDRGVTMLMGRGFYTGKEREVLMCAVRRQETARVRTIVRLADPNAFIIMCEAGDVIGEGFKPINKDEF